MFKIDNLLEILEENEFTVIKDKDVFDILNKGVRMFSTTREEEVYAFMMGYFSYVRINGGIPID